MGEVGTTAIANAAPEHRAQGSRSADLVPEAFQYRPNTEGRRGYASEAEAQQRLGHATVKARKIYRRKVQRVAPLTRHLAPLPP